MTKFRVLRSPKAAEDLIEIYGYIAEQNPRAAEKLLRALGRQFELLGERPRLGRLREDLRPQLRSWSYRRYVVLYREIASGAEIVRVVHGARDLKALFDEDTMSGAADDDVT